ncbi:MAG: hypothetical protein K8T10_20885 [Candidatus Eremiobacteraeota bacterium]|nr:hypothetical protein [Candidatus Eremiobacteraeota bacterium]
MAANITGSNMAMRSQMVGIHQHTSSKKTKRHQETKTIREPEKQKATKKPPKETYTRSKSDQQPKAHRRKINQVMTRYVAGTGKKTESQKAQIKDTEQAKQQGQAKEGQEQQPKAKVPLDNAARIGLMYKSQQRKGTKQTQSRVSNDTPQQPQTQHQQLKKFLSNLRQYVNLEYKQYGSQNNSLYSRRNLREILTALGHQTKAFDNKTSKDRNKRNSGVSNLKSFNKHYEAKARKSLKLFGNEHKENEDPFDMVA